MKLFFLIVATIFVTGFNSFGQNTAWSTSQNIGIGITTPSYPFQLYNSSARSTNNGSYSDFGFDSFNNTSWQGSRLYFGRSRGSVTTPLAVQKGDYLGWLDFYGHDGALAQRSGQIVFIADDVPSSGIVPGAFLFITAGSDGVNAERMRINSAGNVSIGTGDSKGYKFAVNGSAVATSMTVKLSVNWPDYVFKKDYALPSLTDVKTYIDQNQHLPEIPSAQEIEEKGLNLGEMNKLLMKKVEELTLYLIEKDRKEKEQEQINYSLEARLKNLEAKNAPQ